MHAGLVIVVIALLIVTAIVEFKFAKAKQRARAEAYRLKQLAAREVEKLEGDFKHELSAISTEFDATVGRVRKATGKAVTAAGEYVQRS